MKLKTLIDLYLTEGIADLIVIDYFNKTNLQQSIINAKRLLSSKNKKDDFFDQYPTVDLFLQRAFAMYNKKLQQGYIINNSKNNFENSIKPALIDFYNSL